MKKWTLIAAAIALLAVASQAGDYRPDRPRGLRGPREGAPMIGNLLPPRVLEDLQLTAEQKAKYDALQEKFAAEHKEWMQSHRAEGEALREQLRAAREAQDVARIKEAQAKLAEHRKPVEELRKSYMEKVRALLTPDQIKELDEARDRRGPPSEGRGKGPKPD
jgi:Spy/CpxP family protein refolding chaperone